MANIAQFFLVLNLTKSFFGSLIGVQQILLL